MAEETKKGFWQTLPGIITGITALITAVAGLLIALSQAGMLGSKSSATVQSPPTTTAEKAPVQHPDNFSKDGDGAFTDDEKPSANKKLLQLSFNKPAPFMLGGVEFSVVRNVHQKLDANTFGMLLFVNINPNQTGGLREKVELVEDGTVKPVIGQKNGSAPFVTGKTIEEVYRIQGKLGAALLIRFSLNGSVKELPLKVMATS